jgi:quercetin dioxygenase-like cupin family protein
VGDAQSAKTPAWWFDPRITGDAADRLPAFTTKIIKPPTLSDALNGGPVVDHRILIAITTQENKMHIYRAGTAPSGKASAEQFTGTVRRDPLIQSEAPGRVSTGFVTFEPGARTTWHTHPAGQILIITAGRGWIQRKGGPREEVTPGDAVWIPAGEKHWHGATATAAMTHIAVTESVDGRSVDWMEHVTDEEYNRG